MPAPLAKAAGVERPCGTEFESGSDTESDCAEETASTAIESWPSLPEVGTENWPDR